MDLPPTSNSTWYVESWVIFNWTNQQEIIECMLLAAILSQFFIFSLLFFQLFLAFLQIQCFHKVSSDQVNANSLSFLQSETTWNNLRHHIDSVLAIFQEFRKTVVISNTDCPFELEDFGFSIIAVKHRHICNHSLKKAYKSFYTHTHKKLLVELYCSPTWFPLSTQNGEMQHAHH